MRVDCIKKKTDASTPRLSTETSQCVKQRNLTHSYREVKKKQVMRYYSLYGRLLDKRLIHESFRRVKRNKGAAGIDRQSLAAFEANLDEELDNLLLELQEKRYQTQAVRRVTIPKGNGGLRKLGIPTVRDRVVQQALHSVLEPIFDPEFHPSSYGYRKGRGCHDAINKASMFIRRYRRQV